MVAMATAVLVDLVVEEEDITDPPRLLVIIHQHHPHKEIQVVPDLQHPVTVVEVEVV